MHATPTPKRSHELLDDPTLGAIARTLNAAESDFVLLQAPTANRRAWLERMVRDAEALATAARELLAVTT